MPLSEMLLCDHIMHFNCFWKAKPFLPSGLLTCFSFILCLHVRDKACGALLLSFWTDREMEWGDELE